MTLTSRASLRVHRGWLVVDHHDLRARPRGQRNGQRSPVGRAASPRRAGALFHARTRPIRIHIAAHSSITWYRLRVPHDLYTTTVYRILLLL